MNKIMRRLRRQGEVDETMWLSTGEESYDKNSAMMLQLASVFERLAVIDGQLFHDQTAEWEQLKAYVSEKGDSVENVFVESGNIIVQFPDRDIILYLERGESGWVSEEE